MPLFRSSEWKALDKFLQRPVFHRVWIIQEIITACGNVTAHCGNTHLPFKVIVAAVHFIHRCSWDSAIVSYYDPKNDGFSNIIALNNLEEEWIKQGYNTMRRLLYDTRNFQASDPRDKVFGLI